MSVHTKSPLTACRSRGLAGNIRVPGDKSISHRALILGALSVGETTITGLLEGDDVLATADALKALGASIERGDDGTWHVHGTGVGGFQDPRAPLDFGNAGTGVRLMMGVLASQPVTARLTGDASLSGRPMGRVLAPLQRMGAQWQSDGETADRLPGIMKGAEAPVPITYTLPVASAQVKTAILLAGLNTPGITSVIEPKPTRDHTERMLKGFGADIRSQTLERGAVQISVKGHVELSPRAVQVPADPSSAAFAIVAALITPDSELTLCDVMLNPTRDGLVRTLIDMGADINSVNRRDAGGEEIADLVVRSSKLRGVDVPPERAPSMIDEYPVLAVAAACAAGTTRMRGLAELRVKESDRLAAVATGLAAAGVAHRIEGDDLIVDGGTVPGGATVATHMDHRIAMAFLTLGLAAESPITVDDATMIATSFPDFETLLRNAGAQISADPEARS